MSLTQEKIEQWATAYIEVQQRAGTIDADNPLWWSIERFMNMYEQQEAEDAWTTILEILARKPSAQVLGILAAGPLEDLIEEWGTLFIERIELESRQNPEFRHLLGGVWRSGTSVVWERVEKSRGAPW